MPDGKIRNPATTENGRNKLETLAAAMAAHIAAFDPDSEDFRRTMRERIALVSPTFLENWPAKLAVISIPHTGRALTKAEVQALLGASESREGEKRDDADKIEATIRGLEARIDAIVKARFPNGAFVRLGSRSPKDSWYGHEHGFRVADGRTAMRLLLDSMERIMDDLYQAERAGYTPHLFLREWQEIPAWAEFRCFMQNRELKGISQYDYLEAIEHPEITGDPDGIRAAIARFFEESFRDACHLDDVIFDVFLAPERDGYAVRLLEINPFHPAMTDPCLFDWQEPLDGSFRYCGDGRLYRQARRRPDPAALAALLEDDAPDLSKPND